MSNVSMCSKYFPVVLYIFTRSEPTPKRPFGLVKVDYTPGDWNILSVLVLQISKKHEKALIAIKLNFT